MLNFRTSLKSGIAAALIAVTAFAAVAPTAVLAQDRDGRRGGDHNDRGNRDGRNDHRDNNGRGNNGPGPDRPEWRGDRHWEGPSRAVVMRPRPGSYRSYAMPRSRFYNNVRVYRPYGHPYPGFGFYYRDDDAFRFLGLTALSLVALDQLNEAQQRAHEEAMIEASSAPLGEPIIWNEGGRTGSVTAVRDGRTEDGRQCREFQQDVTIGGDKTEAYGTACLQPDGSWEVVNE